MPFGRGKADKRPEDAADEAPEEMAEVGGDAPAGDSQDETGGDGSFVDSPSTEPQTPASAPQMPIEFRPSFLDEDQSSKGAPATTLAAEPPEGNAYFVSITHDGDSEIRRFDDPSAAQAFVEEILEKGTPEEHVTAFSGRKLALTVSHRPVVKLVSGQED
ncbi:MAG: hypothetical protein A2W34_04865 [Chloroflexi bacterium RBG_16_64_32]|nr:MAG: hypothetical protein A2W34_04865 [Chloroflexi bacterium RBG_16_64_32]